MAQNSLFAILLRSAWWISFAIAAGIVVLSRILLPAQYFVFGAVAALPFLVIGGIVGWRRLQQPSAARVARTVERVAAMSWADFSAALETALRNDGYAVARVDAPGVDFELSRDGRKSLVSGRRWKAARSGVEPLRELVAARERREADEILFVATGAISEQAVAFAGERRIRLLRAPELAQLMRRVL
ncbi:MAG: restriction endonuclease [Lautropia sp.]